MNVSTITLGRTDTKITTDSKRPSIQNQKFLPFLHFFLDPNVSSFHLSYMFLKMWIFIKQDKSEFLKLCYHLPHQVCLFNWTLKNHEICTLAMGTNSTFLSYMTLLFIRLRDVPHPLWPMRKLKFQVFPT